jgi:hypothetical protein
VDEKFEEHLSGLMHYRSDPATPFTAGDLIARARHRSRTRTIGVAGSALAVVAVAVGAAALAGGSPSTSPAISTAAGSTTAPSTTAATTTAAPAAKTTSTTQSAPPSTTISSPPALGTSPVKTVRAGEKITVADGYTLWVTSHEKCTNETPAFTDSPPSAGDITDCKDVTGANMAWDGKGNWLGMQGSGFKTKMVLTGTFQGATTPALIDVEEDGKHYPATIVETTGMQQNHWVAYYVTFPAPTKVPTVPGQLGYTTKAYDANGNLLTQDPPVHNN